MALDGESEDIGNLLFDLGLLTPEQLDEAEDLADAWQVSLVQVLQSRRWLKPGTLYKALADYYDLNQVNLVDNPPDTQLMRKYDPKVMTDRMTIPIGILPDGVMVVATSRPGSSTLLHIIETYPPGTEIVVAPQLDISWCLQTAFRDEQSHEAVFGLAETGAAGMIPHWWSTAANHGRDGASGIKLDLIPS